MRVNFKELQVKNPGWGDFVVLSHAVAGTGVTPSQATRLIKKYVSRDDYSLSDLDGLVRHLVGVGAPSNGEVKPSRKT